MPWWLFFLISNSKSSLTHATTQNALKCLLMSCLSCQLWLLFKSCATFAVLYVLSFNSLSFLMIDKAIDRRGTWFCRHFAGMFFSLFCTTCTLSSSHIKKWLNHTRWGCATQSHLGSEYLLNDGNSVVLPFLLDFLIILSTFSWLNEPYSA